MWCSCCCTQCSTSTQLSSPGVSAQAQRPNTGRPAIKHSTQFTVHVNSWTSNKKMLIILSNVPRVLYVMNVSHRCPCPRVLDGVDTNDALSASRSLPKWLRWDNPALLGAGVLLGWHPGSRQRLLPCRLPPLALQRLTCSWSLYNMFSVVSDAGPFPYILSVPLLVLFWTFWVLDGGHKFRSFMDRYRPTSRRGSASGGETGELKRTEEAMESSCK